MPRYPSHDDDSTIPDISVRGESYGWLERFLYLVAGLLIGGLVLSCLRFPKLFVVTLGASLIAGAVLIAWLVFAKRGLFTWMRAANKPAILFAAGRTEEAEAACFYAIERARRFAPYDYRRAVMLHKLALYVRNQGRYSEALAFYAESADILAKHYVTDPCGYFTVLNDYAITYIHLKDYAAAQQSLEKAIDLIGTARMREQEKFAATPISQIQVVMHTNLAFLFIEMNDLAEAELQIMQAGVCRPALADPRAVGWHDAYIAVRALLELESGAPGAAEQTLARAMHRESPACLRLRATVNLARGEYADAENLLLAYQAIKRRTGTLHRPDQIKPALEFSESLLGQGKIHEAFAAMQAARAIVIDFALPTDGVWKKTVESWLHRARDLGMTDVAAALEADLQKMPATIDTAITISDKLRIRQPAAE